MTWADFWTLVRSDGHKVIIVILALIHIWKSFGKQIKSLIKKDEKSAPISCITLPAEGCTIIIKPLNTEQDEILTSAK